MEFGREFSVVLKSGKFPPEVLDSVAHRKGRADLAQLGFLPAQRLVFRSRFRFGVLRGLQFLLPIAVLAGVDIGLLQMPLKRLDIRFDGIESGFALARLVEFVRLPAEPLQPLVQVHKPRDALEQKPPQISLRGKNVLRPGRERLFGKGEHLPPRVAIHSEQEPGKEVVANRLVAGVAQRVLAALSAGDFLQLAADRQRGAYAQVFFVAEVVRRLTLHAEEQIHEADGGRRLPGFVRPVHDVNVGLALLRMAEIDPAVPEHPVPGQIKAAQPHPLSPRRPL